MAERIYIEYDNARITPGERPLVNVEMYGGEMFENLEPRRLFPITGLRKYITLLDDEGNEIAIIRNIDNLMPESRDVIWESLSEYYLIPKITKILDITDKYGKLRFSVETENGPYEFTVKNAHADIKHFFDGRVLIKDSSDNRYDIANVNELDKNSWKILNPFL